MKGQEMIKRIIWTVLVLVLVPLTIGCPDKADPPRVSNPNADSLAAIAQRVGLKNVKPQLAAMGITNDSDSVTLRILYVENDTVFQGIVRRPAAADHYFLDNGFERIGESWRICMDPIYHDGAGNPIAFRSFLATLDPQLRYDINADGQANIGDAITIIRWIFPNSTGGSI